MIQIRKTTAQDSLDVLALYKKAREYMAKNNNPNQWQDLPAITRLVLSDIKKGISYVLLDDGRIEAAFSLKEEAEETYADIEGSWKDDSPYFTIHKLACRTHQKGYSSSLIRFAFLQMRHLRLDTHQDNIPMQRLIQKMGFTYCGIIHLKDGSPRLAYEKVASFEDVLSYWYGFNKRDFPWRKDDDPYHVYLSEIMLQQTRAETVKEYYTRFLSALPTIASLAKCEEDVYLKLWQGLGYYSRVRNLHKTAIIIQERYHGVFPKLKEVLLSLPGIGEYTSSAILSIAFHEKAVAVDGNLFRVFARLTEYPHSIDYGKAKKDCEYYFLKRMTVNPGLFNQALMDLGELVCLPNGLPKCNLCPLRTECLCFHDSSYETYPSKKKKKEKKVLDKTVFLFIYKDKTYIRKREEHGLLASLYEYPNVDSKMNPDDVKKHLEKLGISYFDIRKGIEAKHVFTHLIWQMQSYVVCLDKPLKDMIEVRKADILETYSIPSAFSKFTDYLLENL